MIGINLLDCDFRRWRLELEKVAGGDLPRKGTQAALVGPVLHHVLITIQT